MRRQLAVVWRILSSRILVLLILIVLIPTITILTVMTVNETLTGDGTGSGAQSPEALLSSRVAEMAERIRHAEMLNMERKNELIMLRHRLDHMNNGENISSQPNGQQKGPSITHQHVLTDSIQIPSLVSFLPHLLNVNSETSADPLRPAFLKRSASIPTRTDVSVVIGIPTVRRPVESYLLSTISNLIDNMTPEEMGKALLVIFIAETDMTYVTSQAAEIEEQFSRFIESGLIEIVSPPAAYYPDLQHLPATLGDTVDRTRWRTKQNLDFAYLMMYCQPRGTYYVQLEDDVLSKPGFVSQMINFALKQSLTKDWLLLDFCQLGFIGKMFKSADLSMFAIMFLIFRNDKPVDWILSDFAKTKYCRSDKDVKECRKQMASHWLYSRPSLFQHVGTHSSLKGKVQKLRDKNFGKLNLFKPHADNPPASASTSLRIYKQFSIERAYKGETYFWAYEPSVSDYVTFNFSDPPQITGFLFRSGDGEHPEDKFPVNTTIEVLPVSDKVRDELKDSSSIRLVMKSLAGTAAAPGDGYHVVGLFKGNGIAEGEIPSEIGPIRSLRIRVNTDSQRWVILSEIWIKAEA